MTEPRCPICAKPLPEPPPACRPFCTDRCQWLDLSRWLNEEYVASEPALGLEHGADDDDG